VSPHKTVATLVSSKLLPPLDILPSVATQKGGDLGGVHAAATANAHKAVHIFHLSKIILTRFFMNFLLRYSANE
jgi:hypothetical protein